MVNGRIYVLPSYCKFWDPDTKLCKIYDKRHKLNPECLDVGRGSRIGVFPADCPYVKDIPDYEAPVDGLVDEQLLADIKAGLITTPEEFERRIREIQDRPDRSRKP